MDELTFRKRAYSDPYCKDPEFIACAAKPENQALLEELQAFDQKLATALHTPSCDGLGERIIMKQHMEQHQRQQRRSRGQLAIAASVAFLVGISVSLFNWQGVPPMGEVALAHIYNEAPFLENIDEQVNTHMLNAKLTTFGGQVTGDLGKVYYVNYCAFEGAPALHMVMQGEAGKITVFVIPQSTPVNIDTLQFGDEKLHGKVMLLNGKRVVIVGEKEEPLENAGQALMQAVNWSI